jgi:hypothetical protein
MRTIVDISTLDAEERALDRRNNTICPLASSLRPYHLLAHTMESPYSEKNA